MLNLVTKRIVLSSLILCLMSSHLIAEVKTWDGKHSLEKIRVRVVYFVPKDRQPLLDWKVRAEYYCKRIKQFHQREYGGQSELVTDLLEEPFVSALVTEKLREGDGDAIFFKTLREVDRRLEFAQQKTEEFPILLVLSEINWRPLDDFYRVKPSNQGYEFEGNYNGKEHFPGARSGGARATYLAGNRKGWGLVSADGWRVPYRGSDCVVYHEGVGHTVGLPHPQPGNGSVMSQGQYRGWISESWLDKDQKIRMNWNPEEPAQPTAQEQLFTEFRALPQPLVPQPYENVSLQFDLPDKAQIKDCIVQFQTSLTGPWIEASKSIRNAKLKEFKSLPIGSFDRPTPVSYRVNLKLVDGSTAELWGYFQVRNSPQEFVPPVRHSKDDFEAAAANKFETSNKIDLIKELDTEVAWQHGDWKREENGLLVSPKQYGARIELPGDVPQNYQLVIIVEPLDPPNGLLIGSRMGESRFASLINYMPEDIGLSALENIDGRNVGNETTFKGNLLQQKQLSQIVLTVIGEQVNVTVDGKEIISWEGTSAQLSLSDYWKTPNQKALFLGSYDCRYRFHRVSLSEIVDPN